MTVEQGYRFRVVVEPDWVKLRPVIAKRMREYGLSVGEERSIWPVYRTLIMAGTKLAEPTSGALAYDAVLQHEHDGVTSSWLIPGCTDEGSILNFGLRGAQDIEDQDGDPSDFSLVFKAGMLGFRSAEQRPDANVVLCDFPLWHAVNFHWRASIGRESAPEQIDAAGSRLACRPPHWARGFNLHTAQDGSVWSYSNELCVFGVSVVPIRSV